MADPMNPGPGGPLFNLNPFQNAAQPPGPPTQGGPLFNLNPMAPGGPPSAPPPPPQGAYPGLPPPPAYSSPLLQQAAQQAAQQPTMSPQGTPIPYQSLPQPAGYPPGMQPPPPPSWPGAPPATPATPPPPAGGLSPALAALVAAQTASASEEDAARAVLSNIVKASQRSTNLTEAVKGKSAEEAANAVRDLYMGLSKEQNPHLPLLDAGFLPGEELEMQIMPNSASLRIALRTLAALKATK